MQKAQMKDKFYRYERKLERAIETIKQGNLSDKNKQLILDFKRHLSLENLSDARILSYMHRVPKLAKVINKDLDKVTREDVMCYVETLNKMKYSAWTKTAYKVALKKFFKWLKKTDGFPPEVSFMRTSPRKNELKVLQKDDLVTEDEVKLALDECANIRDKAMIMCLFQSGCRIGELALLQIKDVIFDDHGAILHVNGKTGPRQVRITYASALLGQWIQEHPSKDDKEAPVWTRMSKNQTGGLMSYNQMKKILVKAFARAGIKKRVYNHLFRHSCATHMANHLNQFHMNNHFGWTQGSNMPSVYVHLSGKDTDKQVLLANGVIVADKKELPKQVSCWRCDQINYSGDRFCRKCGSILKTEEAVLFDKKQTEASSLRSNFDNKMNLILQDGLIKKLIEERMRALNM